MLQRDAGGKILLQDNWTTFVKARLNCSLPGQFPFYYNELQNTFLLRKQRLVYAVFTTPPSVYTLYLPHRHVVAYFFTLSSNFSCLTIFCNGFKVIFLLFTAII